MDQYDSTLLKCLLVVLAFSLFISWQHVLDGFWVAFVIIAGTGLLSVIRLRRWREWHHLYLGILIVACASFAQPSVPWLFYVMLLGWLICLDDTYQHAYQVMSLVDLGSYPEDFSPLHRAYVWAARRFA